MHNTLDLLIDGCSGIWHLADQGIVTWYDFAFRTVQETKVSAKYLISIRNNYSISTPLSSERGIIIPSLENAIQRFVREREFNE